MPDEVLLHGECFPLKGMTSSPSVDALARAGISAYPAGAVHVPVQQLQHSGRREPGAGGAAAGAVCGDDLLARPQGPSALRMGGVDYCQASWACTMIISTKSADT